MAEELRRVYDGEIDRVDLTIGLYAEPKPRGLGFSDTAFRIFILMTSGRLNSDRFFTTDFTPRIYTQAGLDWIDDNDMSSALLRHFPGLLASDAHDKAHVRPIVEGWIGIEIAASTAVRLRSQVESL